MKTSFFISLTSAAFTALYGYTAMSKLLDFAPFRAVLSASPLIAEGAGALAPVLVASELTVSLLLIFSRTRLVGLCASFALMVLFTSYLGFMLLYTPHLPCSCGGVIGCLSWPQHLVLNGVLLLLNALALYRYYRQPKTLANRVDTA